jgi:hypothetical protein
MMVLFLSPLLLIGDVIFNGRNDNILQEHSDQEWQKRDWTPKGHQSSQ